MIAGRDAGALAVLKSQDPIEDLQSLALRRAKCPILIRSSTLCGIVSIDDDRGQPKRYRFPEIIQQAI
jgi:hypothetical protein